MARTLTGEPVIETAKGDDGAPKRRKRDAAVGVEAVVSEAEDKIRARLEGRDYQPSPTLARFHASNAFVRGIRGPVGGGKTTGCCEEIMRRAREQVPGPDGKRRTRWAVVRNTYGELKDTTVKTWLEWFPEEWFGKFNRSQGEMKHHVQIGDIDCEVLFRALDKPDDVRKVLSLELTGAFINEAREVPKQIVDALTDRVGRFPPMRDGGPTWRGIIMDTNPPDESHWWHELAEEQRPDDWEFFAQPPGLLNKDGKWVVNPAAENLDNLEGAKDSPPDPGKYYRSRAAGKREDYIKVYYANQYGFVSEGKPVYPEYSDPLHAAKADLGTLPNLPVYIGIGLALNSGALFGQKRANGQWLWLDELMPEWGGAVAFAEQLSAKMASDYAPGTIFKIYTKKPDDPFGAEAEAVQIMRGRRILSSPCRVNDATLRREAVAGVMSRLVNGEPALLISPKCKITRKAMSGGYCYARIQGSGEERYHDTPMENRYAPLAEAAQFMLVGGGEAAYVFQQPKPVKLKYPEMGIV